MLSQKWCLKLGDMAKIIRDFYTTLAQQWFKYEGKQYSMGELEGYHKYSPNFEIHQWECRCKFELQESRFPHQIGEGKYRLLWNNLDDWYEELYVDDLQEANEIFDFVTSFNDFDECRDAMEITGFKTW